MKTFLFAFAVLLALVPGAWAEDIRFSQDKFIASEFSRKVQVRLERTGPVDAALEVRLTAADGSAVAGADYEPFDRLVTFGAGAATTDIEIALTDDALPEPDESFRLTITDLPPGVTSTRSEATVVILDNERPGSVDWAWTSTLGLTEDEFQRAGLLQVIPLPDGDVLIIVGDDATGWGWMVHSWVHSRLRADGSVDESFPKITNNPEGYPIQVKTQADGKLLVYCGSVDRVGGPPRPLFIRLNTDSTVDDSFSPVSNLLGRLDFNFWPMADGSLVLGTWSGVGGTYLMGRLLENGAPDPSFKPPSNAVPSGTSWVNLFPLTNGTILAFSATNLKRFNQDGSLVQGFSGVTERLPGKSGSGVDQVHELEGGRFLLIGDFEKYNGVTVNGIVRILPNGAIDPEFHSGRGTESSSDPSAYVGDRSLRSPKGASFSIRPIPALTDTTARRPGFPLLSMPTAGGTRRSRHQNSSGTMETSACTLMLWMSAP